MISKELYKMLVCPECKGNVSYAKDKNKLRCAKCRIDYKIKEGIPIMVAG